MVYHPGKVPSYVNQTNGGVWFIVTIRSEDDRYLPVLHFDPVADELDRLIKDCSARRYVKFPPMPGASQDPPFHSVDISVGIRWEIGSSDCSQAYRTSGMNADVG